LLEKSDAVHSGELQISEDDRRRRVVQDRHGGLRGGRGVDVEPLPAEDGLQDVELLALVVDYENPPRIDHEALLAGAPAIRPRPWRPPRPVPAAADRSGRSSLCRGRCPPGYLRRGPGRSSA